MKIATFSMHTRQQGISIIELMIALLVGLILMGGIIEVFLSNNQTSSLHMNLTKIQQNGRLAIHTLTTDIRMADYSGCYSDLSDGLENTLNNQAAFAWNLTNPIQGFNNVNSSFTISDTNSGGVISGIIEGTDVLVIKGMTDGVPIRTNPDTKKFTIDESLNRFKDGEILIVADCEQASLFQTSKVDSKDGVTKIEHKSDSRTPGNSTEHIANSYGTDAEIARLRSTAYYLKNDADGNPGLFQSSLTINSAGDTAALQENQLIKNVENMQLQFGVDTDNDSDADVYQDASAVTDWKAVVSIRIALLLVSEAAFLTESNESYSFNASTFTFSKDTTPAAGANRKLRRSFTGFMALRNRTL